MNENLSQEQEAAIKSLEDTQSPVSFLTGNAGTGKSTVIREFLKRNEGKCVIVAPTGVAAVNVGGETIHSFFGLPVKPFTTTDKYVIEDKIFDKFEYLIIDEISMVRVDVFTVIETSLRETDKSKRPFGGKRLICVGDLAQLAPVVSRKEDDSIVLKTFYGGGVFFFEAPIFNQVRINVITLKKVYRQKAGAYLFTLNYLRSGFLGDYELEYINKRVGSQPENVIRLCTINKSVDTENESKLRMIDAKSHLFTGIVTGKYPRDKPTPEMLTVKIGARVMFTANAPSKGFFNGQLGTVKSISNEVIEVKMDTGLTVGVERHTWKYNKYVVEKGELSQREAASYEQMPLKLAYAITIHKSQGVTLDRAHIDLGTGCFAHGQLYVALSRISNYSGLTLETPVAKSDAILDERVEAML